MKFNRPLLLLLAIAGLLYFLGNADIAITDPVESNYTLTAVDMMAHNNFLSPQIYGHYWYDKPIFFYWELILSYTLFGVNEFASRFFPVIFSLASLTMLYYFAKQLYNQKIAIISTVILGTSFEYWLLSKTVITDLTLFLFFNMTLVAFYIAYTTTHKKLYYLCYITAALAVLTKGPIGFLLPGLIIVLFLATQKGLHKVNEMKLLLGVPLFLIIAGSWYGYMYNTHGQAFIDNFLGVHNVLRATVSEHPKDNVWYYYMGIFLIGMFPWSFVLLPKLPKLVKENFRSLKTLDATTTFLLIWALTVNIFFQLMATKYTTYTLPALFPLAILFARLFESKIKMVKTLAIGSIALYTILTYTVAIPLTNQYYSGKEISQTLATLNPDKTVVLSVGNYRTSIPYYSSQDVIRIVPDIDVASTKPNGINWSQKNVMPIIGYSQIPADTDKEVYILINKKEAELPSELEPNTLTLIRKTGTSFLYHVNHSM